MEFVRIFEFDEDIIQLEKDHKWKSAADVAYQQWKLEPNNLRLLLCAGTEIWYALYMNFAYKFDPFPPKGLELGEDGELEDMLWDVASFGERYFSEEPAFNAFFGYMYAVHPYHFHGYQGDYDGWQARGQKMMQKAVSFDPDNPIYAAFAYLNVGDDVGYIRACHKIWENTTPEQWGSAEVQQYFFRILDGERFFPDAYRGKELD